MKPKFVGACWACLGLCLALATVPASGRTPDVSEDRSGSENDIDSDGNSRAVPWPIVVPVARLREGRQHLGSTHNYTTGFPHWANRTLLKQGQKFLAKNFHGFEYAAALTTLLVGVDTQRVLIAGGNTTDVEKASVRYLINVLNFYYWATADMDSDELFEVLNLLHSVHAKVGHEANRKHKMFEKPLIPTPKQGHNPMKINTAVWLAFDRDLLASPLRALRSKEIFPPRDGQTVYPLNQFAMATQLWAFIGFPVIAPDRMLIGRVSDEDLWAYIHFWAFVGRGLGIEDKYNVCLQPDIPTAKRYFADILTEYYVPAILDMTYEHKVVAEVAIKATAQLLGYVDLALALNRVCVDILRIECPHVVRTMPPMAQAANSIVERFSKSSIAETNVAKSSIQFVANGMIHGATLKYLKFSMLNPRNFSQGMLALNSEVLRTSDVHWKENQLQW